MEVAARRAHDRTISPRDLTVRIPAETPRYWMGGDAYSTHLMNALSITFPPGERLFMDAVRHYRDIVTDPSLRAQIRGFIAQEALHSRAHRNFNDWLEGFGVPAGAIEKTISEHIARRRSQRRPLDDLAVTCALEHFTAIMAEGWLGDEALRNLASEPLRSLWTWHALEELDHKSVAFDVYQAVSGDYALRVRTMLRITLGFFIGISSMHLRFMSNDGVLERPAYVAKRWWKYWGPRGHFSRLLPAYLRYYRRDFHPWEHDHSELIARFERELAGIGAVVKRG